MQGNLPPEAQEKLEELQELQGTAQELAVQKAQTETELQEAKEALEHLGQLDDDTEVYQEVGELMVKTTTDDAHDDLTERRDSLEQRVEALGRQEERIEERFEELQSDLQEVLGGLSDLAG